MKIFSSLSHRAVCFLWLPKLTSDVSFNNVTSIGESAFERCGNGWLNLTINDLYCYEISDAAFRNFNGTVNLNGTVKVIYQNAFCNSNNNENFIVNATLSGITEIHQNWLYRFCPWITHTNL